jgi:hypothetical protein
LSRLYCQKRREKDLLGIPYHYPTLAVTRVMNHPSLIAVLVKQTSEVEEAEEAADVELGMSPFSPCDKKKDAHYNAQNV